MTESQQYAFDVADWRRQVHRLYAVVRETADPAVAHEVWVAGRTELFEKHPASPRGPGQKLRHAEYDPAYRFVLPVGEVEPEHFDVPTGTDGVVGFERVGRFELPSWLAGPGGEPASLDIWWLAGYGGGVFLPVRDGTAGSSTYGAGRYLLDTVKGADLGRDAATGDWVVDFNFAYNPSCVYDSRWACPLAPAGNRVAAAIPAGELLPAGY